MRWPALLDRTSRQARLAALALAAVALVFAAAFVRPEVAAWLEQSQTGRAKVAGVSLGELNEQAGIGVKKLITYYSSQ